MIVTLYQPSADLGRPPHYTIYADAWAPAGQLPMEEEEEETRTAAEKMNRLWKRHQALFDATWRIFFAVYICKTLPKFWTWTEETNDGLKVGQIVLLSMEKLARGHWLCARVTAIKEARRTRDGITRTVTVKLANGIKYTPPI
jgi:hypothetical protein